MSWGIGYILVLRQVSIFHVQIMMNVELPKSAGTNLKKPRCCVENNKLPAEFNKDPFNPSTTTLYQPLAYNSLKSSTIQRMVHRYEKIKRNCVFSIFDDTLSTRGK